LLIHAAGNPGRLVPWAIWLGLANFAAGLVVLWFWPQRQIEPD
jgi:hypothetical protein